MEESPRRPRVSIVTATYNRSNVLRWTIESVRAQTVQDWEMLVVGDACTDDTAAVVASFDDGRITFDNLKHNVGDQSGPNNEGVRRGRGDFIAFLNHDDLWFPDHLERGLETIESTGADLVYGLVDRVYPDGRRTVNGAPLNGRYEPGTFIPASAWLLRRHLAERIGPWRQHRQIRAYPSQDWLVRAWREGAHFEQVPALTVAAIGTSARPGSYLNREEAEQQTYWRAIEGNPRWREQVLTDLLVQQPGWLVESSEFLRQAPLRRLLLALAYRPVKPVMLRFGLDPKAVRSILARRPKGYDVMRLRRIRGIDPPIGKTNKGRRQKQGGG